MIVWFVLPLVVGSSRILVCCVSLRGIGFSCFCPGLGFRLRVGCVVLRWFLGYLADSVFVCFGGFADFGGWFWGIVGLLVLVFWFSGFMCCGIDSSWFCEFAFVLVSGFCWWFSMWLRR